MVYLLILQQLLVQQNDDKLREKTVEELIEKMQGYPVLENVEIDGDLRITEYRIDINRDKVKRLSIKWCLFRRCKNVGKTRVVGYDSFLLIT